LMNLRLVSAPKTKVTRKGGDKFRQALPRCFIDY